MASNFGTNIAINTFLREIMRTRLSLFITGVVVVGQSREYIPDSKVSGTSPWQPNFGLNRQKSHKSGQSFSSM